MSKRALSVGMLTAGLSAGLIAGVISPAAAQGNPVGGSGNVYHLAGAGSLGGPAQQVMPFGDPGDVVFFGDWDGDGVGTPMVRRGNEFHVQNRLDPSPPDLVFHSGAPGDTVLVGDWNGDGRDTLAVRRGSTYFLKNDVRTGVADV